MAMTKWDTRRFFSEYAAMQRVSHHRITVSIKDFSYLDIKCSFSKNPGNVGRNRIGIAVIGIALAVL